MPALASVAAFAQAVADFPVSDAGLVLEPAARAAAERSAGESGLLLLGEVHGLRENPLLIRALLQALGLTGLVLEWPPNWPPWSAPSSPGESWRIIRCSGPATAGSPPGTWPCCGSGPRPGPCS